LARSTIFVIAALTLVWVLLVEQLTVQSIITGVIIGVMCVYVVKKFLKFQEIDHVNFYKLAFYPFWLIGRIFMDAVFVMKMIFSNAKWGVTVEKLNLDNEVLRIMLAEAITLTPGSIFLNLKDKDLTLLCLGDRKHEGYPAIVETLRRIEKILLKAQK